MQLISEFFHKEVLLSRKLEITIVFIKLPAMG
jgi:hypothetical protein